MSLKTKSYQRPIGEDYPKFDCITNLGKLIDVAEREFALRQFESSLKISNQILSRVTDVSFPLSNSPIKMVSLPSLIVVGQSYMNARFALISGEPTDNYSNIFSRACAIALQSSFELWKMRDQKCSKLDHKLLCDVTFALDYYRASSKDDSPIFAIDFDLIIMYIDFFNAVGDKKLLIPSIFQVLEYLIELAKKEEYRKEEMDETFYNQFYSLLDTLLLQILAYMNDEKELRISIDAFKVLIEYGEITTLNNLTELNPNVPLRREPVYSSVQEIFRSLSQLTTETSSSSDSNEIFLDALEGVLFVLNDTYLKSDVGSSSHLSSVIDAAADRIGRKITTNNDTVGMIDHNRDDFGVVQGLRAVLHNIWDSEDRWLNRAKIVGSGIVAFALWRQRRAMMRSASYVGKSLMSPVREIASAFSINSPP